MKSQDFVLSKTCNLIENYKKIEQKRYFYLPPPPQKIHGINDSIRGIGTVSKKNSQSASAMVRKTRPGDKMTFLNDTEMCGQHLPPC